MCSLSLFDTEEMKDGLWQFSFAHELQDSMNRKLFFSIYLFIFYFYISEKEAQYKCVLQTSSCITVNAFVEAISHQ